MADRAVERAAKRAARHARREKIRAELAAEYAHSSLRQMAERRGVTWQTLQYRFKWYGIPLRSRGGDTRRFA